MTPRIVVGAVLEEAGQTGWARVEAGTLTLTGSPALWPKAAEISARGTPGGRGPCVPAASSAHPFPEVAAFLT